MLRLAWRLALIAGLNAALALAVLSWHDGRLRYEAWQTDAAIAALPPQPGAFAHVFLGSSRAYLLSRFREHERLVETALGGDVANLAMPTGGGIRPARFHLEYFFHEGHRAPSVVYFADPFVFYNIGSNDAHKFVYFEPFRLSLLWIMARSGYPPRQMLTYVQSKFSWSWLTQGPEEMIAHPGTYPPSSVGPANTQLRLDSLYVDGRSEDVFQRYAEEFLAIYEIAVRHGARFTVVVPPTLLDHDPGLPRMLEFLEKTRESRSMTVIDLSDAIRDPALYYNLDHLNTRGVEVLARMLATRLQP